MITALQAAMTRAESLEPIPPMVHPLGKNWDQPNRNDIQVDDTHAIMSRASFDKLHEYSCSLPSGVYEGKMWKCLNGSFDLAYRKYHKPVWQLRWYGKSNKPDHCSVNCRTIILSDGELPEAS